MAGRRQAYAVRPWFFMAGMLCACAAVAGCGRRPKAPALENEPVYENPAEGFRFMTPDGWTEHAKSEAPPGPADQPRLLVDYVRWNGDIPALLEVSMADVPESADLVHYVDGPSFSARSWRLTAQPQHIEVNGVPATRYVLVNRERQQQRAKEVVAVRRGGRVYFFTGVFDAADAAARDEIRRAVLSIVWEK